MTPDPYDPDGRPPPNTRPDYLAVEWVLVTRIFHRGSLEAWIAAATWTEHT